MVIANYIGDAFLVASGAAKGSELRSVGAVIGSISGTAGLRGNGKKILGQETGVIVMNGARLASLFFIASGFGVGGEEVRLSEVGTGACLFAASTANLNGKPKLGAVFFTATTVTFGAQIVEAVARTGDVDWNMLGALVSFSVSNIASAFVKHGGSKAVKKPDDAIEAGIIDGSFSSMPERS